MHSPVRVKVVFKGKGNSFHKLARQIPSHECATQGDWSGIQFLLDPDERNYDFIVVYDDLPAVGSERFSMRSETLACPRNQTLFVMAEPSSIKLYGHAFLGQFGTIISCQDVWDAPIHKTKRTIPGLLWFYGLPFGQNGERGDPVPYDTIKAITDIEKTADISTICSTKNMTHTLHAKRVAFTMALHDRLPELDVFGFGRDMVSDKRDALDPYRYHIAMENTIAENYITEKLTDAYLGLSFPFYVGAPNVSDYFPADSYIALDPDDPDGAAQIIREAIASNLYAARLPALKEARRRVLDEHNLFAIIARWVKSHPATQQARGQNATTKKFGMIYSRRKKLRISPIAFLRFRYEAFLRRVRITLNRLRRQ